MELTIQDTQRAKGAAVLGMVMVHLFCRLGNLPYTPLIWIGKTPLIYYLGLFGDLCVPVFCFCSGYAHYLLKEKCKAAYPKYIAGKILKFLINFWIVLILFSGVGILSGNGDTMPKSASTFLGNFFLYRLSYNGAWWFVITYIFLSLLSSQLSWVTNKVPAVPLLIISGGIYFVSYQFRFDWSREIPNAALNWCWQQMILFGTSQFPYLLGMAFRKNNWISKLRSYLKDKKPLYQMGWIVVWTMPAVAFVGHCIVQSAFVAPFTAFAVMICLFVCRIPQWQEHVFLVLGKHSTNIWLVHMFFYLTMFEGLVFKAKYPIFILTYMMVLCIASSLVIDVLYRIICNKVFAKK